MACALAARNRCWRRGLTLSNGPHAWTGSLKGAARCTVYKEDVHEARPSTALCKLGDRTRASARACGQCLGYSVHRGRDHWCGMAAVGMKSNATRRWATLAGVMKIAEPNDLADLPPSIPIPRASTTLTTIAFENGSLRDPGGPSSISRTVMHCHTQTAAHYPSETSTAQSTSFHSAPSQGEVPLCTVSR
jgi:hypothetical protein